MKWRMPNRTIRMAVMLMTCLLLLYSQAICAEQLQTLSAPEKAEEFIEMLPEYMFSVTVLEQLRFLRLQNNWSRMMQGLQDSF